ncbi:MAG TPA: hypothetical protein DIS92_04945 [Alistipes sp.]|nr:hypothetical protein [Alistipes sp.]
MNRTARRAVRFFFSAKNGRRSWCESRNTVSLTPPEILLLRKMRVNLLLPSLIAIFAGWKRLLRTNPNVRNTT